MAKMCPETKEKVLYLECLECEERKTCEYEEDEEEELEQ